MSGIEPEVEAPRSGGRQRRSILVAVVVFVLVVVAVLAMTLLAGSDDGDDAAPPVPTGTAIEPLVDTGALTGTIPKGDYTAFCKAVSLQAAGYDPNAGVQAFRSYLRSVDVDALIAVAPEGLRPALETVRDGRGEVVATLAQVDDPAKLEPADFPAGFLEAFTLIAKVGVDRCAPGGSS